MLSSSLPLLFIELSRTDRSSPDSPKATSMLSAKALFPFAMSTSSNEASRIGSILSGYENLLVDGCLGHAGDSNGFEELGALELLLLFGEGFGEGRVLGEGEVNGFVDASGAGVGETIDSRRAPTGTRGMVFLRSLIPRPLGSSSIELKRTVGAETGEVYCGAGSA